MSSVVTLGNANTPIEIYDGPTDRDHIKMLSDSLATAKQGRVSTDQYESPTISNREGESLGNVNRADWRPTFVNEMAGVGLVLRLLPKTITFNGDAVLDLFEPGLYRKHRRRS